MGIIEGGSSLGNVWKLPYRKFGLKGSTEQATWYAFGIIILIITAALFYSVFARPECERFAELSALEVKKAIECAANDGIDPSTGQDCSKSAVVRLCQEDEASVYNVDLFSTYFGLQFPQYMIYYKEFPTIDPRTAAQTMQWSETYPFSRAYTGQRIHDIRPTLTEFKYFSRVKYLEDGCSNDPAICFNSRGQEERFAMDKEVSAKITDVKLLRDRPRFTTMDIVFPAGKFATEAVDLLQTTFNERDAKLTAGLANSENPRFHLVAPCYADVSFIKDSDGIVYADVDRRSTIGASNYCFSTRETIEMMQLVGAGEFSCEIAWIAKDVISLGSTKVAEEGIKTGVKQSMKQLSKRVGKFLTKEALDEVSSNSIKIAEKTILKKGVGVFVKANVKKLAGEGKDAIQTAGIKSIGKETESILLTAMKDAGVKQFGKEIAEESVKEFGERGSKTLLQGAYKKAVRKSATGLDDVGESIGKTQINKMVDDNPAVNKAIKELSENKITKKEALDVVVKEGFGDGLKETVERLGPRTIDDILESGPVTAKAMSMLDDVVGQQIVKEGFLKGVLKAKIVVREAGEEVSEEAIEEISGKFGSKEVSSFAKDRAGRAIGETVDESIGKGAGEVFEKAGKNAAAKAIKGRTYSTIAFKEMGDSGEGVVQETVFRALKKDDAFVKAATKNLDDDALKKISDDVAANIVKNSDLAGKSSKEVLETSVHMGLQNAGDLSGRFSTDTIGDFASRQIVAETAARGAATKGSINAAVKQTVEKDTVGRLTKKLGIAEVRDKIIRENIKDSAVDGFVAQKPTKSIWSKAIAQAAGKSAMRTQKIPATKNQAFLATLFFAVPCADLDVCRGLGACGEMTMWPGVPFAELDSTYFSKNVKSFNTGAEIMSYCCRDYVYGSEKNTSNVLCNDPVDEVSFIKQEMNLNQNESLNLRDLADHIDIRADNIPAVCNLVKGDLSQECMDSLEVTENINAGLEYDSCFQDYTTHTYDFNEVENVNSIAVYVGVKGDECRGNMKVEISEDNLAWGVVDEFQSSEYPKRDYRIIRPVIGQTFDLRYLRIIDSGGCLLDYSAVTLGPYAEGIAAQTDVRYSLRPNDFNFFILPSEYESTAADLCEDVRRCITVSKYDHSTDRFLKYSLDLSETNRGNFPISGDDKIGILVNQTSSVIFRSEK